MCLMIQMSIPHLFRCPISLDIFTDPVTLSTAQTYDRPSIEKWLAGGNLTCPVTMQRLHDASLVPNHTLRHLIDQWLLAGAAGQKAPKPAAGLAGLKQSIQSPGTETKLETLKKIRSLCLESDVGHACLIQLGFLPLLLQFVFQIHQPPFELVELALDCILSLCSATQIDSLNILQKDAALASLIHLMNTGASSKINTSICHLIETIASSPITHDLSLILGSTPAVMERVVALLRDAQTAEAAVGAVSALCGIEANRLSAVREGVVDGLVSYLSGTTGRGSAVVKALATLELAAGMDAGRRGVVSSKGAVTMLVKMVFRVSSIERDDQGSEHAVGALLAACRESGKARAEAVGEGVVTQLLLLLQSQCGGRAKGKARALLKLLRDAWTEDPGCHC